MEKQDLQIEYRPLADLIPYARNSRTHSDEQVAQIAASIKEFGWTNPVLIDDEGGIIAGHGRVLAARKLKIEQAPCIKLAGLSDAQKRAYVIADNRLALNAGWDFEMLSVELDDLNDEGFNLDLLGFTAEELSDLIGNPNSGEGGGLTEDDATPEPPETPVTVLGDVWLLGKHRLMCGDSTSVDAVEKLMDGDIADMVFTDPPYNINYQGVKDKREKIKNDSMTEDDFEIFLTKSIMPCDVLYVCCSWQFAHVFKNAMKKIGCNPKAMIVWDKVNPAQNLDLYFKRHEIIFYYGPFGGSKTIRGDIWQLKRQKNTLHPTMKPVELIEMALDDHKNRRIVYDGFGGSGSTLIACEKTGRINRSMELDPKYCDVIVKRWQDYTGKQATLEATGQTFEELKDLRVGNDA